MIAVYFDNLTNTLIIYGEGEITWVDTVDYADCTEHVVISGNNIRCNNASNLFAGFSMLKDIDGHIDTSMCDDFSYMYANCYTLTKPIENLDTSNGREFDYMHSNNRELEEVSFNDTSKGVKFIKMFNDCSKLRSISGVTVRDEKDIIKVSDIFDIQNMIKV